MKHMAVHAFAASFIALGCTARLLSAGPSEPQTLSSFEFSDLQTLASDGNIEAQLELGERYRDGRGVPRDVSEAIDWYVQAVHADPSAAMEHLVCGPVLEERQLDVVLTALDRAAFPADSPDPLPGVGSLGVSAPTVLRDVMPDYTRAALSDRIEGTVGLDIVVLRNGAVGGLRVVRSLDREKGLDQSAACAASKWQFAPATTDDGTPTAFIIRGMVLSFELR